MGVVFFGFGVFFPRQLLPFLCLFMLIKDVATELKEHIKAWIYILNEVPGGIGEGSYKNFFIITNSGSQSLNMKIGMTNK